MSFLNLSLLAGTAAFTIPLAIHLLNRSRFEVRNWGAMHLLDAALEVNSRRIEWHSLLLLLLRCLIPILLAAALARPTLRSFQAGQLDQKIALGIVLDDSFSMDNSIGLNPVPVNNSAWLDAQQAAQNLLQQYPKSQKAVLTSSNFSDSSQQYLGTDSVLAENALLSFHPTAGFSDPVAATSHCANQLKASSQIANPASQIVIISDFRSANWLGPDIRRSLNQLAASNPNCNFTLLPVGEGGESPKPRTWKQASVHFGSVVPDRQFQSQAFEVPVEVRNWDSEQRLETILRVTIDSREVLTQELEINAGGIFQGSVRLNVPEAGTHVLKAALGQDDQWPQDNVDFRCLHIESPIQVLRITNQNQDETDYLRFALMPFVKADQAPNAFTIDDIRPNELAERLERFSSSNDTDTPSTASPIILLDGVRRLNDGLAEQLVAYIRDGGRLLIAANPRLDPNWANKELIAKYQLAGHEFAPVSAHDPPLKLLSTDSATNARVLLDPSLIDNASPITFKRTMPLLKIPMQEATSNETDLPRVKAKAVLERIVRLSDGSPLIALEQFGKGRVLQLGFRFNPEWTNLTQLPQIVPIAQQIFFAISPDETVSNTKAGGTLHWKAKPASRFTVNYTGRGEATVAFANEITASESGDVAFSRATQAGLYRLAPTNEVNSESGRPTGPAARSVSSVRSESDPRRLNNGELEDLASGFGATLAKSAEEVQTQTVERQNGRELWRLLIIAVLGALVLESWLAGRLTSGTPTGTGNASTRVNWEVK